MSKLQADIVGKCHQWLVKRLPHRIPYRLSFLMTILSMLKVIKHLPFDSFTPNTSLIWTYQTVYYFNIDNKGLSHSKTFTSN